MINGVDGTALRPVPRKFLQSPSPVPGWSQAERAVGSHPLRVPGPGGPRASPLSQGSGWGGEQRGRSHGPLALLSSKLPSVTRRDLGGWRGLWAGRAGDTPAPLPGPRGLVPAEPLNHRASQFTSVLPAESPGPLLTRAQAAPCLRVGSQGEGLLTPAGESGPAGTQSWLAWLAAHSALETDVQGGRQEVRLFQDRDPGHSEDRPSPCWGLSVLLWELLHQGQGPQAEKAKVSRPSVVQG